MLISLRFIRTSYAGRYISIGSSYYAGIEFPIDHQIEDWRMTMQIFIFVLIFLVLFILLLTATKITQINERLVIFRRDKLRSIKGPGLILINYTKPSALQVVPALIYSFLLNYTLNSDFRDFRVFRSSKKRRYMTSSNLSLRF